MKTKDLYQDIPKYLPEGIDEQIIVYCGSEEIGRITKYEFINILDARMSIKEAHQTVNSFDDGLQYIKKQFDEFVKNIKK